MCRATNSAVGKKSFGGIKCRSAYENSEVLYSFRWRSQLAIDKYHLVEAAKKGAVHPLVLCSF